MNRRLVVRSAYLLALLSVTAPAIAIGGPTSISGKVLAPDGKPVTGAEVVLTQDDNVSAEPNQPAAKRHKATRSTRSAADGTFTLPLDKPNGRYALGVAHDAGYADVNENSLPADGVLTLRPWGRIEGTISRGGKPLAGAKLHTEHLIRRGRPAVSFNASATAGPDGRFAFARAVPGFVSVIAYDAEGHEAFGRYAEVEPGKAARVQLGGAGRRVIGRIDLTPLGDVKFDESLFQANGLVTRPPAPDFYEPQDREDPHGAAYENELAWRQTDEGKAHYRRLYGVGLRLKPDGTFEVDGVPPGEYDLHVYLDRREDGTPVTDGPLVEMDRAVTIPEGPQGEPVDLGLLEADKVDGPGL